MGWLEWRSRAGLARADTGLSRRRGIPLLLGAEYLPAEPRLYQTKVKNAQEAHEAVRPAGHPFDFPEQLRGELSADEFKVYDLIWKRTVASQMADGARLAKAFPKVVFVLEHAGMLEDTSTDGLRRWREGMMALADCPNVNAKLSGLGTFVHACREDLMKFIVTETVDMFGAKRCLFGSNFPIEKLWTDYKTLYENFRKAIAGLAESEQVAILHDTAARLYRIG